MSQTAAPGLAEEGRARIGGSDVPDGTERASRKRAKSDKKSSSKRSSKDKKRHKSGKKHKSKKEKREKKRRKHSERNHSDSSSSWSSSSSSSSESEREVRKSDNLAPTSVPDGSVHADRSPEEDDDTYGPVVPFARAAATAATGLMQAATAAKDFGDHLLAGEGSAMAAFVQQNERIPRRGEVGWDGDKIKQLEGMGYVMSGSRHKRMEAVRQRKENQIFSAEEKRLLLINETQKRQEREAMVLEEMRHLIKKKEHEEAAKKLQPSSN